MKGRVLPASVLNFNGANEYQRMGALAYLAAWDVQLGKIFGLCRPSTGIESFHGLVDLVMGQEPYRLARRVFWITDNGSSHKGQSSINRLTDWYPNAIQVHTSIHASSTKLKLTFRFYYAKC